jgi:hypothetical protein
MDYTPQNMDEIYKRLQALTEKARAELVKEGFAENQIYVEVLLSSLRSGRGARVVIIVMLDHNFKK